MRKNTRKTARVVPIKEVDDLLKSVLVLARGVAYVLETQAVESASPKHLSSSKIQILRLLHQRGTHNAGQVGRFLHVSKPAVTQLIDSMVRSKLVLRTNATGDRREVNLRLSQQGKRLAMAIREQQRHRLRTALRNAGLGSAAAWTRTLEGVTSHLAQADKQFNDYCLQCGAHEDGSCVLVGGNACCSLSDAPSQSPKGKGKKRITRSKSSAKR